MPDKKKEGVSDHFKKAIKIHLEKTAKEDPLFAKTYAKENKSLDECCNYILQQVQKSGLNGFTDDEIFGMAVHYYDEDDIKDIKEAPKCKIISNHFHELTEEDQNEAKEKAIREIIQEEKARLKQKAERKIEKSKPKPEMKVEKTTDEKGNITDVKVTKIDPPKEKPKFEQQSLF